MKSKNKTKSSTPDLYKDESKTLMTESNEEKANVLAEFFPSVFTRESDSNLPDIEIKDIPPLDIVEKKLKDLKIDKAPGPDHSSPHILKDLQSFIALPLSIIFNNSIDTASMPKEWKSANIMALKREIKSMQAITDQ